jgi:tetratricopeptide (TPR) repeat protein
MHHATRYAHDLSDANIAAHAEYWLGWIYYALGEQKNAITHYHRAASSAQEACNDRLRAQLVSNLGQSHAAAGEYEVALAYLREGIALKRATAAGGRRGGAVPAGFGYALGCQAMVHGHRGEFNEGYRCLDEALDAVKSSGHAVEGSLLGARALVQMWQSCWELCIDTAALSRAAAERVNGPFVFAMCEMVSGYARWQLDRSPGALVQLQRAVDWLESRGMRLYLSCNYAYLAEALAAADQTEPARNYALRAIERASQQDPVGEASAHRTLARLAAAARGPLDEEARSQLDQAASAAERIGSPREAALTSLLAGELRVAAGEGQAARAGLESAAAAFARMQMPFYLAAAPRLLARM